MVEASPEVMGCFTMAADCHVDISLRGISLQNFIDGGSIAFALVLLLQEAAYARHVVDFYDHFCRC